MRLDKYLFDNGLAESRTRAANLIALGRVSVNGKTVSKCSFDVETKDEVIVTENYEASLGGIKLIKALESFAIEPKGKVCLDVGASNGGFTDVLLKNGARKVYCLDVGECALPERLKKDSRVEIMDKTNARFIKKEQFTVIPQIAVVDVSFISLKLVLDPISEVLTQDGIIIALIKPQFECSAKDLTKKGIVKNEKLRLSAVKSVEQFCKELGLAEEGLTEAPHPFEEKNQEYLILLKKKSGFIA